MELDFTLSKYEELCDVIISSNILTLTVERYLSNPALTDPFLIIRHDVDKAPENALKMAKIENEKGISATYYFRTGKKILKPEIIKAIAKLGHEIGYHYETLSKTNGDYLLAIQMFEKELNILREICGIKTVCMHGNSLSQWDNRDLWKKYNFKDYDILGEAYLSFDFRDIFYISDSGGAWENKGFRVRDLVDSPYSQSFKIKSTNDLIKMIGEKEVEKKYILIHPDRWNDTLASWSYEYISKRVRNIGKSGVIWFRKSKGVLNDSQ